MPSTSLPVALCLTVALAAPAFAAEPTHADRGAAGHAAAPARASGFAPRAEPGFSRTRAEPGFARSGVDRRAYEARTIRESNFHSVSRTSIHSYEGYRGAYVGVGRFGGGWDWRAAWGPYGRGFGWGGPGFIGGWAWGGILLGADIGVIVAPPPIFLPPPIYEAPPPIVLGLPAIEPPPALAPTPPPSAAEQSATTGALIASAVPPPIVVLPPPPVLAEAAPPPAIFAPPGFAFGIAPPELAFVTIGPQYWDGPYLTGGLFFRTGLFGGWGGPWGYGWGGGFGHYGYGYGGRYYGGRGFYGAGYRGFYAGPRGYAGYRGYAAPGRVFAHPGYGHAFGNPHYSNPHFGGDHFGAPHGAPHGFGPHR